MPDQELDNGPIYAFGLALVKTLDESPAILELAPGGAFIGELPQHKAPTTQTPYIVIERLDEIPENQVNRRATRVAASIAVDHFSQSGMTMAMLAGRLKALLDENLQPLAGNAPPGWCIWKCQHMGTNMATLDDGIHRLMIRFEARLQQCQQMK